MRTKLTHGDKVCIIFIRTGVRDLYLCHSSGYWPHLYQEAPPSVGHVYGGGGGRDDCVSSRVHTAAGDVRTPRPLSDHSRPLSEQRCPGYLSQIQSEGCP